MFIHTVGTDCNQLLLFQDVSAGPNGNKDPDTYDGMVDAEIESRLKVRFCI